MSDDDYAGDFDEVVDKPAPARAPLPVIQIDDGNLLGVIEQAEKAILEAPKQYLFQRGGMLVRLKRIAQKTTIKGVKPRHNAASSVRLHVCLCERSRDGGRSR